MIHVQIASQVTANGVNGIRWVLVEPIDAVQGPTPALDAVATNTSESVAAALDKAALPSSVRLTLLKGLVILLGLGAALGMARMQFGAPAVRWWAPAPVLQPPPQPTNAQPPPRAPPAPVPANPRSAGAPGAEATHS